MKRWQVLQAAKNKKKDLAISKIVDLLLKNRGISTAKEKKEFINPKNPMAITLKSIGLNRRHINKSIDRIKKAKKKGEKIFVYGDYDADGICGTAILWECLYELGIDAMPYIPDRFSEGYGLNKNSVEKISQENPDVKLVITVDNGITAYEGLTCAKKHGIDVIITDHHRLGTKKLKAHSVVHTTEISGAGLAWIFSREIGKKLLRSKTKIDSGLELAAIGTISDQMPLVGANRSFAKYGLDELNKTKRPGLLALFEEAAIKKRKIGTYDINFVIAPRINAPGRLSHAIESLRLLCVTNRSKAKDLAFLLGKTNRQRQQIVDEVVAHAKANTEKEKWEGAIILQNKKYHQGVIGLAASKLVEAYYRPAIVLSEGSKISKASARSIPGFNIIENIMKLEKLLEEGGGHPMAAGFSIQNSKVDQFTKKMTKLSKKLLTKEILSRKLKIDLNISFKQISWKLLKEISKFEPSGVGNPTPTFTTKDVNVLNIRAVGKGASHLKLVLEEGDKIIDAIAFGFGRYFLKITPDTRVDLAYTIEENIWLDKRTLQLKIKDIRFDSNSKK